MRTRRLREFELRTLPLRSEHRSDNNAQRDDNSSNTHDRTISLNPLPINASDERLFSDSIDDLRGGRRDHVPDLISDTRKRGAKGHGRQFIEVDGNNAPGTLDEELHEEAGGAETAFGGREDPRGDHEAGHQGGDADCATAADPLGEVADDSTSDTGTGFHQDAGA